ncbi:Alpha/Beta hydrolase protein [Spinellus fusiger]|nr:Alpha/Beta hydrolase protein [Spinellus fusiger]
MFNAYKNLFLTFYFNWTMLISAPVSSMSFLVFFPTAVMFLFIFEVGLKVFMDYLGGVSLVRYISMKYGHGFGAINWGTPGLLLCEDVATLVRATLPSLGVPTKEKTGQRNKTFDLSIAQTLIVLSSVIYERDTDLVKDAYELYVQSMDSGKVNFDDDMESECERDMKQLMWDSESRIRSISASWGLHFAGVSELKSLGGPFCGIFWSEEHPFIVIAFKGTTPTNYEEFLVDGTFQRTDARSYLFGSVHEGFYESVFPSAGFGNEDTRDPYGAILAAIHEKSAQLQESLRTDVPVQVWITGHSLGAAMSSLLFARWLKCPKDLTKRCVLRDAYVIGTPAVGDNDFASNFSSYTNNPVSRSSTLWRMINKSDIICRLPPGYDNSTIGHYMKTTDFFNYSHVGHAIQINRPWSSKPFHVYPSGYQVTMQIEIVLGAWGGRSFPKENYRQHTKISHNYRHNPFKNEKELVLPRLAVFLSDQAWLQFFVNTFTDGNPIHILESVYPFFFQDHLPVNYFDGLGRIRDFCHDTEQRQRRTKD